MGWEERKTLKDSKFSDAQKAFILKQREDENAKLRKLVADLALDREMLQDVIRRKL